MALYTGNHATVAHPAGTLHESSVMPLIGRFIPFLGFAAVVVALIGLAVAISWVYGLLIRTFWLVGVRAGRVATISLPLDGGWRCMCLRSASLPYGNVELKFSSWMPFELLFHIYNNVVGKGHHLTIDATGIDHFGLEHLSDFLSAKKEIAERICLKGLTHLEKGRLMQLSGVYLPYGKGHISVSGTGLRAEASVYGLSEEDRAEVKVEAEKITKALKDARHLGLDMKWAADAAQGAAMIAASRRR